MTLNRREQRRVSLLKLLRDFGTQAKFADHVGIAATLVSRYIKGTKGIGEDMRDKIEDAFHLPRGWLDTDHGEKLESASPPPPDRPSQTTPVETNHISPGRAVLSPAAQKIIRRLEQVEASGSSSPQMFVTLGAVLDMAAPDAIRPDDARRNMESALHADPAGLSSSADVLIRPTRNTKNSV